MCYRAGQQHLLEILASYLAILKILDFFLLSTLLFLLNLFRTLSENPQICLTPNPVQKFSEKNDIYSTWPLYPGWSPSFFIEFTSRLPNLLVSLSRFLKCCITMEDTWTPGFRPIPHPPSGQASLPPEARLPWSLTWHFTAASEILQIASAIKSPHNGQSDILK